MADITVLTVSILNLVAATCLFQIGRSMKGLKPPEALGITNNTAIKA